MSTSRFLKIVVPSALLLLLLIVGSRWYWQKRQEKIALLAQIRQQAHAGVVEDVYTKKIAQLRIRLANNPPDEIRIAATHALEYYQQQLRAEGLAERCPEAMAPVAPSVANKKK